MWAGVGIDPDDEQVGLSDGRDLCEYGHCDVLLWTDVVAGVGLGRSHRGTSLSWATTREGRTCF